MSPPAAAPAATPKTWPPLLLMVGAQATVVLPVVLIGALSLRMRRDLDLDDAAVGAVVALNFVASALASATAGRLAERVGATVALRVGLLVSAVSLVGIALAARDRVTLGAFLVGAGTGAAAVTSSSNLWLSRIMPPGRQGFAFGLKQSGPPLAGVLAGVAVPTVAATFGWRWVFGVAGVATAVLATAVKVAPGGAVRSPQADGSRTLAPACLAMLAVGMCFGTMAIFAFVTFGVSGAVESGMAENRAALLFSVGGAIGIVTRVGVGVLADFRLRRLLLTVSCMLALGSLGFVVLAMEHATASMLAIPFLFSTIWGWPGLFALAIVRRSDKPAAASGITSTGAFAGGALGPLLFGFIVPHGYPVAWLAAAGSAVAAAAMMFVARMRIRRDVRLAEVALPLGAPTSG